ncbi:MAG TPA: hypothetical protein VJU86_09055 [Pyrinomonadaceae bacterium]|nr:hypothetical protein [Pyrinomonadaceae bacterium]
MSRTRNAGIIAIFGYMQFALAFISGIVLLPLILKKIGAETYGWWLACGELLAYSAMVDFGVLGILPWSIAQRDGEKDREAIRRLIANGILIASLTGLVYVLVAAMLWHFASYVMGLGEAQQALLFFPLVIVICCTGLSFPLRTFAAALQGMQDVVFLGIAGVIQWFLNVGVAIVLLFRGHGLYALAFALAVPPLVYSLMCLVRVWFIAPDLLRGWTRTKLSELYGLTRDGLGVWLGNIGWRMAAASNSLVIVAIIDPASAVVFACTVKMGEILMQMAWQLSDSGLIGLAQLSGEANEVRVRATVQNLLRLLLIATGAVSLLVLMANPTFVRLWVGASKFGGYTLNAILVINLLAISIVHGIFTTASVLGKRIEIGIAAFLQGLAAIGLAVLLGNYYGLGGVAAASVLGAFLVALPLGVRNLYRISGAGWSRLWNDVILPWTSKALSPFLVGTIVAAWISSRSSFLWIGLVPAVMALYLWQMRPLFADLPLPTRIRPWLLRMRILPETGS